MTASLVATLLPACVDYGLRDPDSAGPAPVEVVEEFDQAPLPGLDVLFVVDSTGSMAEEQAGFAAGAADLVATLEGLGLAWQLGVVSTDLDDAGALLGRPWIVTAQAEDPAADFAAALLAPGTASDPPAAGLDAAALALQDADGANAGFRRDDAALHVVFLSDGDDESGDVLGADPAEAFLALMAEEAARTGRLARASAVVGDVPGGCEGEGGDALPGERYAAVARDAGGAVVSICAEDLGAVAVGLGEAGVEWPTSFVLQAVPGDDLEIEVDGERVLEGWELDASVPAVVFDVAPAPGARVVVRYTLGGPS